MRSALTTVALVTAALSAYAAPAIQPQLPFGIVSNTDPASEMAHSLTADERPFERVKLTLGVMSRCPDAVLVETLFDRVLEKKSSVVEGSPAVAELVDLRLEYIAAKNSSALYDATCKHGDIECKGNIQQLCAKKEWSSKKVDTVASSSGHGADDSSDTGSDVSVSLKGNQAWEDWWNFVQCLNYGELSQIGTDRRARECAKIVGHDWSDREEHCVAGKKGRKLLRKSVKRTHKLGVEKSATVLLGERVICIHDGSWQNCPGGHEISDFVRQIEDEFKRLNPGKKHK